MNFWLLALVLLILHGASFGEDAGERGLDKDMSLQWRGIFAVLICMTHYMLYFPYRDMPGHEQMVAVWNWLDQLVVVPFLFFNGYGTALRVKAKGWPYARGLVTRKLPGLYLRYILATLLILTVHFFLNLTYTPGSMLMAFTGWTHFYHDDQWYIVMLMAMYVLMALSWLPLKLLKLKGRKAECLWAALVTLCCLALVFLVRRKGKGYYWYDTMIALPVGVWWGLLRKDIEALLKDSLFYSLFLLGCVFGLSFFYAYRSEGVINQFFMVTFFSLLIPTLSMKARFSSPILAFFGKHSLAVYLLMRIPMLILQRMVLVYTEPAVAFLFVLLAVAAMVQLFDRIADGIQPLIDKLSCKLEVLLK